jgi:FkbM family methyltransferase
MRNQQNKAMGIISYAQNFEDVILWRALKHVARGFYIDVGAQDPVVDSVSLAFYEKGWRGVHVEPTAAYAEKLRQARPDETVIQAAIGTSAQSIAFWEFPDTGLSTGIRSIATKHERDNRKAVGVEVPCMRLSDLLFDYRDRDIHWLKIDVEGMERAVIQSWRPATARPWIVVVESTKPNSPEPAFSDWEPLLIKLGYDFVYFDGLNRFYASREHPELKKHFGPGPNVFDEFALSGTANAPFYARIAAEAGSLREQAAHLSNRVDELHSQVAMQTETFAKPVAVWDGANALLHDELAERNKHIEDLIAWAKSLEADLLARNTALATSDAWAKTLEADLLARTEALAARDAELARTREPLTASDARAKSFEADVLARNEALAARNAELARTREALTARYAWAKSLVADVLARTEALAAVYGSKSFRITAPLRNASRAARWFMRGSIPWLTLRPGSRPRRVTRRLRMMLFPTDRSRTEISDPVQDTPDDNIPALASPTNISSSARSVYAELKAAIALHEGAADAHRHRHAGGAISWFAGQRHWPVHRVALPGRGTQPRRP